MRAGNATLAAFLGHVAAGALCGTVTEEDAFAGTDVATGQSDAELSEGIVLVEVVVVGLERILDGLLLALLGGFDDVELDAQGCL